MIKITTNDLNLLSKKLNISVAQTELLTDQDSDLYLITQKLSPELSDEEIKELSFPLNYQSYILKHAQNINEKEKKYVITSVISLFPKMLHTIKTLKLIVDYTGNEEIAKKNLILCGLFNSEYSTMHLVTMEKGFKNTPIDIKNIQFWIQLLNNSNFLRKKSIDLILKSV